MKYGEKNLICAGLRFEVLHVVNLLKIIGSEILTHDMSFDQAKVPCHMATSDRL